MIEVPVQEETSAMVLPNFTAPGAPKTEPRIVTLVPTDPWVGDSKLIFAVDTGGIVVVLTGGVVVVVKAGGVVVVDAALARVSDARIK